MFAFDAGYEPSPWEPISEETSSWWARATDVWPDRESYRAATDRQIPVFVLEPADR